MKHKKDKTESIVFSNDESAEILFEKIKGWEISSQVEFIVSFDNPKRKELFEKIFEAVTNETVKQNISLIVQRIEQAGFQVSGYNPSEIEYYQSLFAKDFYTVLHSETYQTYIEDKIRELHFYCKGLEQDLRTNQYEFLEDREQDKNQFTEAERYKFYLESFIIHLKNPAPQQTETKTDKLKADLGKYGFFELPKVKELSEPNKQSLIELISTRGLPYSIAMFDFLGFLKHIKNEHFEINDKLNKEVAKWFNSDKIGRAVKGNISSLSAYSTENKSKYTAHTHKETVKTDYQKLK
jgi:hypothetical protein